MDDGALHGPLLPLRLTTSEASIHRGRWSAIIADIEAQWPGWACDIVLCPATADLPPPPWIAPARMRARHLAEKWHRLRKNEERPLDAILPQAGGERPHNGTVSCLEEGICVLLHAARRQYWLLVLHLKDATGDRKTGADRETGWLERAQDLASALAPAFRLTLAIEGRATFYPSDARSVWDRLPYGVMLLDPSLRVSHQNAAAQDLLGARRFFLPPADGRIRLWNTEARQELEDAVFRQTLGRRSDPEPVAIEAGGQRLVITLRACRPRMAEPPEETVSGSAKVVRVLATIRLLGAEA